MSAIQSMNPTPSWALFALIVLVLLATGHINQLAHYHDFADQTRWLLLPNGKDVWSNVGLILIGLWACYGLKRVHIPFTGRISACVLVSAIVLTGLGSSYYHLQPNDFSLIWDRLPISLICAGLLGMVFQYTHQRSDGVVLSSAVVFAVLGVWYCQWRFAPVFGHAGVHHFGLALVAVASACATRHHHGLVVGHRLLHRLQSHRSLGHANFYRHCPSHQRPHFEAFVRDHGDGLCGGGHACHVANLSQRKRRPLSKS